MRAHLYVDTRQKKSVPEKLFHNLASLKKEGYFDYARIYDASVDAPLFNEKGIIRTPTLIIIDNKENEYWIPPCCEDMDKDELVDLIIDEMSRRSFAVIPPHPYKEEAEETENEEEEKEVSVDNPSYYKEAKVEAIDLMHELMTHEQFEGFLWGNIIKYAYRYGRKGSKGETAAKIRQYAEWLEDTARD